MDTIKKIKISIIIPAHNAEMFILETLESVFRQQYEPLEIIVVDDGSVDSTCSICQPYVTENKIKYFYQKKGGLPSARTAGIKASTGDAVMFLDSDDLLPEGILSKMAQRLSELDEQYCLVYGKMEHFSHLTGETLKIDDFQGIFKSRARIFGDRGNCLLACLVRKKAIDEVGYFKDEFSNPNISTGFEMYLIMKLAQAKKKFAPVDDIAVKYRIRADSMSKTVKPERARFHIEMRQKMLNEVLVNENILIWLYAWSCHYQMAGVYTSPFDVEKCQKFLVKSILINPFNLTALRLLVASFRGRWPQPSQTLDRA